MTKQEFATLAYTKSPKTSKRTTFQDELQAAVSARASRAIMDQYSDDFDDDEDDFFNKLLNSRKKKVDAFKGGRSKAKIVSFEFSDDEDKPTKTKRVSFLKTHRISSPVEGTSTDRQIENEHSSHSIDGCSDYSSIPSKHSTNVSDQSSDKRSDLGSTHSQDKQQSTNRSLSHQLSEETLRDMPLPLPSDSSIGENFYPVTADHNGTPQPTLLKKTAETELPIPKPRQRIQGVTNHAIEKQSASQDLSVLSTFSASVTLATQTPDQETRFSSNHAEGDCTALCSISHSFSNDFKSEDSKDQVLSFEELAISHPLTATVDDSGDQLDFSTTQLNSHIPDNSHDTLTSHCHVEGPQRPLRVSSKKVESKYLGTLKILDRNISIQESQPQAADLRAAVYQEWLKKKKEKSRQIMDKKKEEIVTEKKKKEQEAKKEDAVASYEAWKEKKLESLKVKAKEKQEQLRKEQRAYEEKEEKRHIAQQVFENWKQEHNHLIKERYRKVRKNEIEQKFLKQEKEEGRKSSSNSAFSEWCEKKTINLVKKAAAKRKELKDNAETERYMKEERDKMALDMYESWLARKNLEKKRHKEERWLQEILQDSSTPPPWSPPNKTIPYGK